jgi:hypothetical protein
MKNFWRSLSLGALIAIPASSGGVFYGLWWDGSTEQFVSVNPYTSAMTVIRNLPGVTGVVPGPLMDPDSSRYGFVGVEGSQKYYYALHAPTGDLVAKVAKTDTLSGLIYSPNDRKVYGLSWADTGSYIDSLGRRVHVPFAGNEYFVSLDPYTGARTNTYLPNVIAYQANSTVLDSDSGRYIVTAREKNHQDFYYVIEAATGSVLSRIPAAHKIDNPVYDPALQAVHGLWWADSSYYADSMIVGDSIKVPKGPKVVKGTEYFVTVHRDSTVTRVAIPGIKYIATFISAFDSDSGRYVFVGGTSGSDMKYYVIDVATGAVLSQTLRTHNVNNLAYAPARSTFDSTYLPVSVAPRAPAVSAYRIGLDPIGGYALLEWNGSGAGSLLLRDATGRAALRRALSTGHNRVYLGGLKPGVYVYEIHEGGRRLDAGKLPVH